MPIDITQFAVGLVTGIVFMLLWPDFFKGMFDQSDKKGSEHK